MRVVVICFFLIALGSITALGGVPSGDDALLKEVAYSPYWLRLLHYEKSLWGGYKSRVVNSPFFLASDGRVNPLSELEANIASFSKKLEIGRLKQHPQCAFPERFRFLKEKLNLEIAPVKCPKFQQYIDRFNPESVTLVFSSAYPHNPGSMFGHTFFRINTKTRNIEKQDLLDWGISYAAQVADDENGFAFVFLGLTGGYHGEFSLLPYYAKVNEYVNNESRDLWEYELNLSSEETFRLLRNVWEVETNGYFDYYFLDENCAYQLLAFLEVAKPDWNLVDFPIYVIPGETVKKLTEIDGAVKTIKYRPSLQKKLFKHYSLLNQEQRSNVQEVISYHLSPLQIQEPKVLDQVAEYLLYLKKKKDNELSIEEKKLFRETLVQRSRLASSDKGIIAANEIIETSRPDLAHDTFRLGVSTGSEFREFAEVQNQWFQEIHFKFAFHDLLNSDLGYTPFSQLDFPGMTLRYYDKSRDFIVENIHFLSLTSLSPIEPLENHLSWSFHIERASPKDLSCNHCQVLHLDGGAGASLGFAEGKGIFYSLLIGQVEVGNDFQKGFRLIPKWQWGSIINWGNRYKLQVLGNIVWDVMQKNRMNRFYDFGINQSVSFGKNWDFRVLTQVILEPGFHMRFYEGRAAWNYYF